MLSAEEIVLRFVAKTIRRDRRRRQLTTRKFSAPCGGCAKRTACKGAQQKELGHDDLKTPAIYRPRRKPFLSGTAAPRHCRIPAHDCAAVRRPREIDPRPRRGDEERRADSAGNAEECFRL